MRPTKTFGLGGLKAVRAVNHLPDAAKSDGKLFSPRRQLSSIKRQPYRTLMVVVGGGLLLLLVYLRIQDERIPWQKGQRAPRDIRAHKFAIYEDSEATARRRQEARANAPKVYDERTAIALRETKQFINSLFVEVNEARHEQLTDLARLNFLRDRLTNISLSHSTLSTLVLAPDADIPLIEDLAQKLAQTRESQEIKPEDLEEARQLLAEDAQQVQAPEEIVTAATEIAQLALRPNRVLNHEKTLANQDAEEAKVKPVTDQIERGDLIIKAGDTVEQVHIDMFTALGMTTHGDTNLAARLVASAMAIVVLLGVFGYYLRRSRPQFMRTGRSMGVLMGSFVTAALAARLGARSAVFEATDLAAVASLAIVLSVLLDTEVAVVASIFMAFFAEMSAPGSDPRLMIGAATAGIIAALTSGAGGSRPRLIARTAITCAVANSFLAGAFSTVFGLPIALPQLALSALGGILAAVFAGGGILVLERPLKIVTEVRLLELSSTNEPLLKRLALEAPGTYASSIAVANLAEAAANGIGADALLVRVGCYYHDIGKIKRPYYFIENQQGLTNPHSRLTPHLSARVIISHVKDGLELAQEAGLPSEIQAFIAQHHGTTAVEYFYERALQEAEKADEVLETAFRYPGPKPQSRETAILMLADTVEAASRTIENPDLDSVRTMVHNLIQHKIEDGQLDESNLTFGDIHTIEEIFTRTLVAIHHQRIRYPEQLENGGKEHLANGRAAS
ncbi:MAG: HD family phosphohydrolase [Candidatus Zipacnadales bacterium]